MFLCHAARAHVGKWHGLVSVHILVAWILPLKSTLSRLRAPSEAEMTVPLALYCPSHLLSIAAQQPLFCMSHKKEDGDVLLLCTIDFDFCTAG